MSAQLLRLTAHATVRMSQRGITPDDLQLALWIGSEVEGGYLVREKDVQALERTIKDFLKKARRLVGKRIVIAGDVAVTAYHASKKKERALLRGAEDRGYLEGVS